MHDFGVIIEECSQRPGSAACGEKHFFGRGQFETEEREEWPFREVVRYGEGGVCVCMCAEVGGLFVCMCTCMCVDCVSVCVYTCVGVGVCVGVWVYACVDCVWVSPHVCKPLYNVGIFIEECPWRPGSAACGE